MPTLVKFLYCPKCKELRPKAWFSISNTCMSCRGPARVILIRATTLTYVKYALWVAVMALIAVHLKLEDRFYLWVAVACLLAAMVLAYIDLLRGERKARARIRMTSGDLETFRKLRWI
jgi:prepilin signal peptidase PulO-like enzyme (type II secretory pathway)